MINLMAARRLIAELGLTLTPEQATVVLGAPAGPAVVVAGAGSGKTAVMAARIAVLVAAGGIPAHEVLGLTFTRKAAGELAERVDGYLRSARRLGLIGPLESDPDIATYHSFAQRFVREHGVWCGIDPDLRVETDFGLLPLAYQSVVGSTALAAATNHDFTLAKAVSTMRHLDAELAEHVVSTERLRAHENARIDAMATARPSERTRALAAASAARVLASQLVDEFRVAKSLAGVMDYADMMRLAHHIATASEEAVQRTRSAYTAVLLDEYQDTSVVQRRLLQRLFGEGHQLLAVGDPKQSIYAFRGAAAGSIESFPEHFPQPSGAPTQVFTLSTNFRSGPAIVAASNDAAASRRAMAMGGTGVQLTSGRADAEDVVEVHSFRTESDEQKFVVAGVAEELAAGRSGADVLVLARNNDAVSALTAALEAAGIPAISSNQEGLFDLPQVRDVLAELAVIVDPTANAELVRLLLGPRWRIGLRDLNLLGARARELAGAAWSPTDGSELSERLGAAAGRGADVIELPCLADALADPGHADFSPAARRRFGLLSSELNSLARHAGEPVPDLLARILRTTGADIEILLRDDAERINAAIDALLNVAASFPANSPGAQAAGFLRLVRLARESDADPGFDVPVPPDCVQVMTVHKAKGLEADVVFWPDCAAQVYDTVRLRDHWTSHAGALPEDLRGDRPAAAGLVAPLTTAEVDEVREQAKRLEQAETERLIYVALTRARQRLVVSNHRWSRTRQRARTPAAHLHALAARPDVVLGTWHEPPDDDTDNPLLGASDAVTERPLEVVDSADVRRLEEQAALVREFAAGAGESGAGESEAEFGGGEGAHLVARWDTDIDALERELAERLAGKIQVTLPDGMSASALQRLINEPTDYAESLRRPMPLRPSRHAKRGTRFHEWVARRWDQGTLVDLGEFAADSHLDLEVEADLSDLIAAFEVGEYADRRPTHIEYPFTVTLAGVPVSGRIDAVFALPPPAGQADAGSGGRWEVVDWKTSTRESADDLQLALYRLAWAKLAGADPADVRAAFYYVPTGRRVEVTDLPSEADLAARIRGTIDG